MRKGTNIIIRVDEEVKSKFQELAEKNGTTMSTILNAAMADMVNKDCIPLRIRGKINALKYEQQRHLDILAIKSAILSTIKEAKLEDKIKKVCLFGSYSRGEETDDSDIDLRIEHMNDFDLFDLSEMSYLLKLKTGKSVDIATQEISKMDPAFYNTIKQDEICLYERA